jgi:hypothetical protein
MRSQTYRFYLGSLFLLGGVGIEVVGSAAGSCCFLDDGLLGGGGTDGGLWISGLVDDGLLLELGSLAGEHGGRMDRVMDGEIDGRAAASETDQRLTAGVTSTGSGQRRKDELGPTTSRSSSVRSRVISTMEVTDVTTKKENRKAPLGSSGGGRWAIGN